MKQNRRQTMNESCDIACQRLTFTSEEKKQYEQLRSELFSHLIRIEELTDGYDFLFPASHSRLLISMAEWIPLELKCCPFLSVAIFIRHDELVHLHLTGPTEVKSFLLEELQLSGMMLS